MKYPENVIIEYIVMFISEFGRRFGLTPRQAFLYLDNHDALSDIEKHYGIMHTLTFEDDIEKIASYCAGKGAYSKMCDERSGLMFKNPGYLFCFLKDEIKYGHL